MMPMFVAILLLISLGTVQSGPAADDATTCAVDKIVAAPWNTEAATVWTEASLAPRVPPADSPASSAGSKLCARVTVLGDPALRVPVGAAAVAAVGNTTAGANRQQAAGDHGSVFIVANGDNSGIWLSYRPSCLQTLVRMRRSITRMSQLA